MKKILIRVVDGVQYILGIGFVLIAAPIIHFSGLNRVDDYPNIAEIDVSVGHDEKMSRNSM